MFDWLGDLWTDSWAEQAWDALPGGSPTSSSGSSWSDGLWEAATDPRVIGAVVPGVLSVASNREKQKQAEREQERRDKQLDSDIRLANEQLELKKKELELRMLERSSSGASSTPSMINALTSASNGIIDSLSQMGAGYSNSLRR